MTACNSSSCCITYINKLTGSCGDAICHQLFQPDLSVNWVEGLCVSTVELKASPKDGDSICVTVDKILPSAVYYLLWYKREGGIWLHFRGGIFWAGSEVKHISVCKLSTLGREAEKDNKHGTPQCHFYSLFFREKLHFKMCVRASRSRVCVFLAPHYLEQCSFRLRSEKQAARLLVGGALFRWCGVLLR